MSSRFLIDSEPLIILRPLAKKVGICEAVILQQLHYWLSSSKVAGVIIDGEKYIYNTLEQWHQQIDLWSQRTLARAFAHLEEQGYILTATRPGNAWDRTKCYRIDYARMLEMESVAEENGTTHPVTESDSILSDFQPPSCQIGKMIHTENNTEITSENNVRAARTGRRTTRAVRLPSGETVLEAYRPEGEDERVAPLSQPHPPAAGAASTLPPVAPPPPPAPRSASDDPFDPRPTPRYASGGSLVDQGGRSEFAAVQSAARAEIARILAKLEAGSERQKKVAREWRDDGGARYATDSQRLEALRTQVRREADIQKALARRRNDETTVGHAPESPGGACP